MKWALLSQQEQGFLFGKILDFFHEEFFDFHRDFGDGGTFEKSAGG
jgi:hypothetical protein